METNRSVPVSAQFRTAMASILLSTSNIYVGFKCVSAQFRELQAEITRRRAECSELRNILVNNTEGLKSIAKSNYSPDADLDSINEDGELVLAFETQKKINRSAYEYAVSMKHFTRIINNERNHIVRFIFIVADI